MRNLVVVLGDQLNRDSAAFDDFDPKQDAVWMAEVHNESTHVWSHKARIALFLSAMRRFRDARRGEGLSLHYRELRPGTLAECLEIDLKKLRPKRVVCVEAGEFRVKESLAPFIDEWLPDRHFLCTPEEFAAHAKGRKQLRMEYFYREMRKRNGVLMQAGKPVGGKWNYDPENRGSFPKSGPPPIPRSPAFPLDPEVRAVVERTFPDHPGRLDNFDWPVTPEQALEALDDFIANRLSDFGRYQDAMWRDEPFLYHARLSSSMNLKLLDPRIVIRAAETAEAPLAAREGFIRQILGWREYVRGIYWLKMPEYLELNALDAREPLPRFYWSNETDMECMRQAIGQTLQYGYAHHIQRLMVTGLFSMLYGVDPVEIHKWYLAVYVDAVEWVELPNTTGMSQFADGGLMASKPYAATGKYIARMSNYCKHCRYKPDEPVGEDACPFTTLYWDFLLRHEDKLRHVGRMDMQLRNLTRLSPEKKERIASRAAAFRERLRRAGPSPQSPGPDGPR
jgi:deoxyribodipyrimidine photolyase-related protein